MRRPAVAGVVWYGKGIAGKSRISCCVSEPFIRYDHNSWSGKLIEQYLRAVAVVPVERFVSRSGADGVSVLESPGVIACIPATSKLVFMAGHTVIKKLNAIYRP